jgi:hypothetical protein
MRSDNSFEALHARIARSEERIRKADQERAAVQVRLKEARQRLEAIENSTPRGLGGCSTSDSYQPPRSTGQSWGGAGSSFDSSGSVRSDGAWANSLVGRSSYGGC